MKYAIIDVGSNSVRLMIRDGNITVTKITRTTKLAQGIAETNKLRQDAIERTVDALSDLKDIAITKYGTEPRVFATEAVRSATNKIDFLDKVRLECGLEVDVVDGEVEAEIGFLGAFVKGKTCVVDIGGASTEIVVGDESGIEYAQSVKIGAVRLRDMCGEEESKLSQVVMNEIKKYGIVPKFNEMVAIGGTASTLVAIVLGMDVYDTNKVHNYILHKAEILRQYEKLGHLTLNERLEVKGLQRGRADIIVGAIYELIAIMDYLGVQECRVSEYDNLEGYLIRERMNN